MQKNYPFFETTLSEAKNGIFQIINGNENWAIGKIVLQRFLALSFLFLTNLGYSQFATESFESGLPGTWAITSNLATAPSNNWTATPNGGYLNSGGVFVNPSSNNTVGSKAEYYMISPQFLTPSNGEIRFFTKQGSFTNRGTTYQIKISTANQPDVSSFNVVLQSWTETQLNSAALTYEEKIIPIPTIPAGIPVYIAFVAITNQTGTTATSGDTWFVDNVRVNTICTPVIDITTVIGIDNAVINWTHPNASNFGVEVVPSGAGHSANGNPISGFTYTANGLLPNTSYDFYIKTNCDVATSSSWAGPFSFTTTKLGLNCANPILIPSDVTTSPYVLSTNLNQFYTSDHPDLTTVGSNCFPPNQFSQNQLIGNRVFFSYTPTTSGLIDITQAVSVISGGGPDACYNDSSSVLVYNSCADVGGNCLAAILTESNKTTNQISNFYVEAGNSYVIVISSPYEHSQSNNASICFTFTVSGSTCPSPASSGTTYNNLTQTSAVFSWANVGNLVSSWEYVVLPVTSGAPSPSTIVTPTSTNRNNPVLGLTPSTDYNFYVRSVCNGTPGLWAAPVAFTTPCNVSSLPYYTGFTNASESECWSQLNLNNDLNSFNFGSSAFSEPVAACRTENSNDMLVSPQFNFDGVTPKRLRFKFNNYGNWGLIVDNPVGGKCTFEVRLSTTGVGPDNFTTVVLPVAEYTTAYNFVEIFVPIPNVVGNVNIAWILPSGALQEGNWFYLDDVYIEDLPSCSEPSYPVVTPGSITSTSATISWTNGFNNTQWELVAQPLGTGIPTTPGIIVDTNPFTLTNLIPSTRYELYMRAVCSATEQSIWVGPINFNTLCIAQPTPYYESLNTDDPNTKKFCWSVINNSDEISTWRIEDTEAQIRGISTFTSPFVSFDDWLVSAPVNAVGLKRLRFNYRAVNGIFNPTPRGNVEVLMSSSQDFSTYTVLIPSFDFTNLDYEEKSVLFTGTGIIYIAFRVPPTMTNPGNSGIMMIDDVTIDDAPGCPDPTDLNSTTITTTSANLSWKIGYNETQWQVVVQTAGTGIPTGSGTVVNTTPEYSATGLTPDTLYEYYVRAVCSGNGNSTWVGPFTFKTICNALPTPFLETFDSSSTTESCWTIVNGNIDSNEWNLNQTTNPISGDQMAALFTGSNGNNNDWLITPTLTVQPNQRLRFYYKVYDGSFEEDLKVMLSTNGVATDQFSTILYENSLNSFTDANGVVAGSKTITLASAQEAARVKPGDFIYIPGFPFPYPTYVATVQGTLITMSTTATITQTGVQNVQFQHVAINNEKVKEMVINLTDITVPTNINLAFHTPYFPPNPWQYRGQYTFIDNVIVEDIPVCSSVINVTTNNIIDTTADINWVTTGSETSWEISVQPFGSAAPVGETLPAYLHTTTTHPYTVTGLIPATKYQYYIRAICSGTSQSEWVGPYEFITRCDFSNVCQYTMSVTNGNTGQVTNNVSVKQNGVEVQALEFPGFGQPTTTDYTVFLCSGVEFNLYWNGLGSGVQYSEAQISIKDESNTVIWTSPLGLGTVNTNIYTGFASCGTITCPQPTNTTVSNKGVFSWTPGGSETQWEVFVQPVNNGTLPQSGTSVSSPTYTPLASDFTNLTASTYEYFVRAICGPTNKSYWSGPFVFVRNDEPITAVNLQVNTGTTCDVSGVDVSFIGATPSAIPTACPGINGGDVWFDFVATSKVHTIELSDFAPGSYYTSSYEGPWPKIMMSLYEVQSDGSLVEKGCSENNSFVTSYLSELVVGKTYKIRLLLNENSTINKKFHICITTPIDLCDLNAFNNDFEKLPMQNVTGILTIIDAKVVPGWRVNTEAGQMFYQEQNNSLNVTPYSGGQCIQLIQDDPSEWNPNDPNIKGLYKDFDTSEISMMDYSFASATRSSSTTVQLFAGPPSGPFTLVTEHTATSLVWQLIQGNYIVPTGQTTTRFIFRVKNYDIGHILDAANFKANVEININTENTILDCATTAMNFDANGVGQWVADDNNPGTTIIANPDSGATNVSGFITPGAYVFYWNTRYCQKSITITKQGTTATATVTSPVTYCIGATATPLTATPPSGTTLMWYTLANGGSGTTTAPTPETTIAGNTTYYVSVADSNGCEGPPTEIVVRVNPIPTATISGTTTVCLNTPCTPIIFTGANGVAPYTFTYTDNNGVNQTIKSTGNSATICVPTAITGVFTYTLVNVSNDGLEACSQPQTGTAVVTVETLPTATILGTSTICAGQTATISFNGTPNSTVSYTVNNGANQTIVLDAAGLAAISTATLSASATYALVSVTSSGTTACSQIVTGSAIVTVNPVVTPNVAFSYAQACSNSGVNSLPIVSNNFITGGVFSSSSVTVNPTTGAVNLSTASVASHQITYTLPANAPTCSTGATSTATLVVVSNISPITEFSYNATYCFNAANALPTTVSGFTSGGVFSAGNGLIINPTSGEININQSNAGNYTITYTVQANTAACNSGGSSTFDITITPNLIFTMEDFCQNSNLTLQLTNSNFNSDGASYTWAQGGNTIGTTSTLNVDSYLAQNTSLQLPLVFTVSVGIDGCTTQQNLTVENNPCLLIPKGISPNNDEVNDTFDLTGYGVKELLIFNRYGTKVYSFSGKYSNQWKGQSSGGSELPDGTYFYTIHTTDGTAKTGWVYINREY